ncbi:hypothetical protein CCH79_00019507 [Gambusia affinis]|uniref:Uncharacterized protein n=1 Tax=Gambusia affinis TaxID=33528 RepID=A0A315VK98_GAMAF|nr:hypothetical protein CCH79_00019507 [Gambusia affinis]
MATLGPESARPPLAQLGSPPSNQPHVGCANLPPNRGLERALEEAAASGVLNLSCRKLKEFPRTAANHDLSDTVEAVVNRHGRHQGPTQRQIVLKTATSCAQVHSCADRAVISCGAAPTLSQRGLRSFPAVRPDPDPPKPPPPQAIVQYFSQTDGKAEQGNVSPSRLLQPPGRRHSQAWCNSHLNRKEKSYGIINLRPAVSGVGQKQ